MTECLSYATSWDTYIDGHIVSKSSLRFITNLLTATAACKTEQSDDSSEDLDQEAWRNLELQVGNMDLVHQTLRGIAARSADEGQKAIGRHAKTIRLGRSLWQSNPLSADVVAGMRERFFDDSHFPPLAEMRFVVAQAKKKGGATTGSIHEQNPTICFSVSCKLRRTSSLMA